MWRTLFGSSLSLRSAGAAATSVLVADQCWRRQDAEACGIVGVIGHEKDDASGFLLEGLMVLRNRGYDSAGLATFGDKGSPLTVTKFASKADTADSIDLLRAKAGKHVGHSVGIAHTRWATHGGKTDQNAHPHTDSKGRIALVHNGTINNANDLRRELQAKGVHFSSETDTEVVAQLIGSILDESHDQISIRDATAKALSRCDGSWGIAVMSKMNPEEIVVACNGSPMTIGLGQDKTFIASEPAAFNRYTKNFIAMQDGEIGVVRAQGTSLDLARTEVAPELEIRATPDPFPHWTIRECLEQPEAIARALGFGGRLSEDQVYLGGLDRNRKRMEKVKHVILSGCGTSLNASLYGAKLMREYDAFDTAMPIDAAELRTHDLPRADAALIAVSQSGETKDVHRAVVSAMQEGLPCISVVNAVGSLIARTTKLGVYCNAGRENAVASTKAFTTQVTVLALVTCWFRQMRDQLSHNSNYCRESTQPLMEALARLPISFGMANRLRPKCKQLAERVKDKEHLFILGKGYAEPIAYEGALKIKECTYLHAEGYSGGALKHGPFALIEGPAGKRGATPIICLILDDEYAQQMRIVAEEVKARGAECFIITDNPKLADGLDPDPLVIPRNGPLTALTAVLPLQFLAYELAVLRGINPDVPRNLAKAVTVD
uniref:Glutamine--fructose-6-phosphate aminotransferase [isomerizing] n=1 Tax=Rhizochromulina marina TaxID=1034831 RepID=A0A7S2R8P1_9STRA|mmetsp:Transcript_12730/g.36903  ORF Transcript_12730/g.36903 Transcript_12730/m.36903 type:complete len:662 (+) Transcript_12730:44-2029(+)|eukprot:CAMPEP_0118965570 /NCGR_PEP_ID=MMETSP1173-20130426/3106_1 /TAXON_ID=1034831 /ORGANISM="Rhizochromulina marina cf, Strain CCMP1243" /LENGTH=661 /DNA_ID=CAMNT_0006914217 /DNA_START=46 /DNA_END=2031 /DNA_ORIENTATION=-